MKTILNLFLAFSLLLSINLPVFAQSQSLNWLKSEQFRTGKNTSQITEIQPMYIQLYLSKEDQAKVNQLAPKVNSINKAIKDINANALHLQYREQFENNRYNRNSVLENDFSNMLEKKKQSADMEYQTVRQIDSQLKNNLDSTINQLGFAGNMNPLFKQYLINRAFMAYKTAGNYDTFMTLPEGSKKPQELQKLLANEVSTLNRLMQQGPAYKSFAALEAETKKIHNEQVVDNLLLLAFTLYGLKGMNMKAKPLSISSSSWLARAGGKAALWGKRAVIFTGDIAVFTAFESANMRALNLSISELGARYTALQDRYRIAEALAKSINEDAISEKKLSLIGDLMQIFKSKEVNITTRLQLAVAYASIYPFARNAEQAEWKDKVQQQTALRRLYGLRVINTYLQHSNASYKYDLALLDLFHLFSSQETMLFDIKAFDNYAAEAGEMVLKEHNSNSVPVSTTGSLMERSDWMIENLKKMPADLKFEKKFYKALQLPDGEIILLPADELDMKKNDAFNPLYMRFEPQGYSNNPYTYTDDGRVLMVI